jgi:hypothetical protein
LIRHKNKFGYTKCKEFILPSDAKIKRTPPKFGGVPVRITTTYKPKP